MSKTIRVLPGAEPRQLSKDLLDEIASSEFDTLGVDPRWRRVYGLLLDRDFYVAAIERVVDALPPLEHPHDLACTLANQIQVVIGNNDYLDRLHTLRPLEEYHEDFGTVLWWKLPIVEPPYVGSPLDTRWPDYHTHWSPLPDDHKLRASDGSAVSR